MSSRAPYWFCWLLSAAVLSGSLSAQSDDGAGGGLNERPSYWEGGDRAPLPGTTAPWDGVPAAEVGYTSERVDDACRCDGEQLCCTCEKKKALKAAAATAYKDLFYQNDFSYLGDPCYDGWHLGERLKRVPVGDCWTVDLGGQYRARYHHEQNLLNTPAVPNQLGLTGADGDYLLHRIRLYMNAEYGRHLRIYGEMLDALREAGGGPPRVIEENRADIQNLFLDLRGLEAGSGTLGFRVGRQEIALGAERLVSPLDWANTRRTFDGARLMWQGENWDVDGFWLRPMNRYVANNQSLDSPNQNRQLYGSYASYKGLSRDKLELYWLGYQVEDVGPSGYHYQTLGTRYYGGSDALLYEFEGGYQLGKNADDSDHAAGFITTGLGRKLSQVKYTPTVWLYYDWASGDNTVGNGFNHLEPLAHKYLGYMDLFARSNIEDYNCQVTAQLSDKVKFLFWYHYLLLANRNDVPYNVNMTPFAGLAAGTSGSRELGHEIDFLITQTLNARSAIVYGYSHFFSGNYYETSPVPFNGDADFAYLQWHVNF